MALGRAPKIISEVKEFIQDLKRNYEDTQLPVSDDSVPLHKLCAKLEYMLQIDMKPSARSGMFAGKKDYWDYIYQCLYKVKGLDDGIRFVRAKSEVKTSLGRGRAFIRYSLAHHRLGDSLQQCFNNQKITSAWYNPNSLLLNPSLYGPLVNDLYDLNDLQFDLAPSGHDLDAAWPTHSRHVMGPSPGMYSSWQPPSRTESLSSLSSQPSTLDGYPSPTAESRQIIGEERALHQAQTELEECEQVNRELRKRIIQLESDNDDMHRLAMETEERLSSTQSDLERKVQQLQYELEKSSKESLDITEKMNRSEENWRKKIEDAEKVNSDLCSRLEATNIQHASQAKLWQEAERDHQTKLIEAERSLAEVRVELTGFKGELDTIKGMEMRKDKTIHSLEEKVDGMETKNAELLKKMEGMVDSKDAEVANHLQSANKVHELLDKLSEAESKNLELRGEKDALSRQIELLEDNHSSQEKDIVAKVADLEMILSKKESENKIMNENIAAQDVKHDCVVQELQAMVSALKEDKEKLQCDLNEHLQKFENSSKSFESVQNENMQSKTAIASMQQKMVELQKDTERLRKELHAAGVKNEEFKARIKHTEGVCQERQKEIDDLDKEIKEQVSKNTDINGLLESERGRTANLETQCRDNQNKVIEMEKEKSKLMQQFKIVMKMLSLGEEASIERESLQGSNDEPDSADARGTLITQHLSRMVSEKDNALQLVKELQVENQSLSKEVERLTEKTVHDSEDVSQKADLVIKTEKEIGDLQLKLDTMGKMLESKEKSLQTQSIERQRIEGQLQEAMNEKEKLEMDIVRLRLAIDSKDKERDALIMDKTTLELARDGLEKDKEISKQEKDGMDKKLGEQVEVISKLMADIELLKAQKQEAEEGRDSVLKQLDRERLTTRELEDTVEDLKRLQEETVSLEQVYEERKTKMTQEHADKVEFLTEQFQLLKEEQEKTSGERLHYQEQSEDFSKELDQVKERCEILETENKAVRDKNNDLNMEILRMQEEVELSKTERIEITDKLEQVSTETSKSLQETKLEMERLQGKVEQEEERSRRIKELEEILEKEKEKGQSAEAKTQEAEEETHRVRSTLEEEISALKFQLSSEAMQYQQTLQGYHEQESDLESLKIQNNEQQQTIQELSNEIETVKKQSNQDKINFQKKLSEQENEIARQEQQITIHEASVEELSRCLEEEKRKSVSLQSEVTELRNESGNRVTSLEKELALAEDDNEQLKKQLVKLIKEKDTLWKRTEKLEYHRKMKASERWLDDKQVTQCMSCMCEFSLTVRKHHCRLCGRIFCAKCTDFFVLTSHSKKKSRVCEQCYVGHQHSLEAASVNTSIISTNSHDDSLDDGHPSNQSTRDMPGGSSSVASDEGLSDVMSESVNSEPVTMDDVDESLRIVGMDAIAQGDPKHRLNREDMVPSPTLTSENTASEPDFDIIGEDEVSAARQDEKDNEENERDSKPDENTRTDGQLLSADELEGEGLTGEEVTVAAYQKHHLPVAINDVGLMLCWEFVSSPKSIGFSVVFQDSSDTTSPQEELIPLCKCNSHQHAVQGELLARKPGIYTLIFDNKFSRFTSKTVKYSLTINRPEAAY
ncbi:FYVE and coiled-coil domain-containing protein 1-like isoform X1 [Lytechinus variegatus]|uniref:FYVE and coiled-coil domain-containing protein 1-like isoform X1 n=1 Tax=Lytechinus variegatus TaxID=7654 RepID=UPI001BB1C2EF|nr:FYVE and coiled-coil domain-containing protein 1-like isoform X1 [Lytechinus variegatus]